MNKVILIGRLTANPEIKQTQSGISICRFNIAVNRPYQKDRDRQECDYISCQAWRNTADFVSRYFSKGKPIIVEGSLRNNNYTDKNGVNHYGMDVLVESVEFTINDNSQQQTTSYQQQPRQNNQYNNYQQAPQQQYPNQYPQQPYAPTQPNYQQNSQQYQQPSQQVNAPQNQTNANNLNNFEEIISDGDIPF